MFSIGDRSYNQGDIGEEGKPDGLGHHHGEQDFRLDAFRTSGNAFCFELDKVQSNILSRKLSALSTEYSSND